MLTDTSPRPDLPVDALQELAEVERLLRADTRNADPLVHVGMRGARISFRTAPYNEHTRGSLTASVVNEIAATSDWAVSTIHDPPPARRIRTVDALDRLRVRTGRRGRGLTMMRVGRRHGDRTSNESFPWIEIGSSDQSSLTNSSISSCIFSPASVHDS